ncbi:hypothetical protein [Caulobacter sp. 3R27C2-B]|uniref:hypothetical protein n=1 Tax=Caulobacter sp. 3R27C2-B TaxID=2502219 RepID=UPI0010F84EA6|nr:hypothetical protein [Caulobacter sp. 3R27C2-B]
MDATPPAAANPADKILDNLDAFAGVVVAVLVSGVFPLSSNQNRQLLQAQTALKGSTDEIRKLLAGMEDEDFIPEGMFSGYGAARLSSEDELRAKDQALLADLLAEESSVVVGDIRSGPEISDFGRQLIGLPDEAALKSLLALTVDDIDGLAKTLKGLKAKSAAREVPPASEEAPAADPPADPTADLLAAEPAAAPTPEA